MTLAAFDLKDLIPAGAITLIAAGLLLHYRKKKASLTHNRLTPHEQLDRNRQMRGLRGDLEDMMVEIEQLAKRFGNQLDAKTIELEDMIQQADERIARLEELLEHQPGQPGGQPAGDQPANTEAAAGVTYHDPEPQLPDDPLARSVYQLADDGVEPIDIAQQLGEHVGKVELILALRNA